MDLNLPLSGQPVVVVNSATVIADQVRRGELSARDSVAGAITAARSQQERLNAATLIDEDRALERAEEIDRMVEAGEDPGRLAGVPVALKDLIDHAGRPTTCGSSWYREIPEKSATVVERLETDGAVIVTRTGLHEFAYGFSSENHWFGPVRNPLDASLSPGGSSGGSAASVGGGQVPLAVGTDTGGSVRVPAALCGVFGLKVSHGRVPITGVFPLAASLDTVGPIGASVSDIQAGYLTLAGYDPNDPWSVPRPVITPGGARPDLRGLRIAVPVPWIDDAPVADEVAESFAEAMAALEALGATVEQLVDPDLAPPGMILELSGGEIAALHRPFIEEGHEYGPEVHARIDRALQVTLDEYVAANRWRARIRQRTTEAFETFDLIATPAVGSTRKVIGEDTIVTSSGPHHYRSVLAVFSALVNTMGCPALVGPLRSDTTPPPSLQLIAPWWEEHRLLEVAATLESNGILVRPQ